MSKKIPKGRVLMGGDFFAGDGLLNTRILIFMQARTKRVYLNCCTFLKDNLQFLPWFYILLLFYQTL